MSADAPGVARDELLPLLKALCELLQNEGETQQLDFFERVRLGVEQARDDEDLAGPFAELSMSAFLGFQYSPLATLLIDRILATAQTLATTLSAAGEAH